MKDFKKARPTKLLWIDLDPPVWPTGRAGMTVISRKLYDVL